MHGLHSQAPSPGRPLIDLPLFMSGGIPDDPYELHRDVSRIMLPPESDVTRNFLFSADPEFGGVVVVRSREIPARMATHGNAVATPPVGSIHQFRLVARPSYKNSDGSWRRPDPGPAERQRWLQRRAASRGFRLTRDPDVTVDTVRISFKTGPGFAERAVFSGELEVVDAELFEQTLEKGIGRSKAFGFGMLFLVT